jgi:hypothetical protein
VAWVEVDDWVRVDAGASDSGEGGVNNSTTSESNIFLEQYVLLAPSRRVR